MVDKSKFISEGYTLSVKTKNLQMTDAIRNYLMEKLEKIDRFADSIIDIMVTLEVQKLSHIVTIIMKFAHTKIKVEANTEDLYAAIDKATDRLILLIRKYKTRLQDYHFQHLATVDLNVNVLRSKHFDDTVYVNDEIENENLKEDLEKYKFHEIVANENRPLKILTQDEAIMKMELSGDTFMPYKAEEDQKLKIIYRREDDDFGIIELQ
ncbi:MAG: ribosome-associated translation inhibitor RaiA [Parachlamydiales bacterium]|nr:ribosome-associated translation inhibitor RaiA [Parachlamydiales bacterium]